MEPITRREQYYDGMINDTPVPDPILREEQFLKNLADKIAQGGGGGGSGSLPVFNAESYTTGDETTFPRCAVTFTDIDYIGDVGKMSPFYINATNNENKPLILLCIPEFGREAFGEQYAYIRATIISNGYTGVVYPKATADNPLKYVFYTDFSRNPVGGTYSNPCDLYYAATTYSKLHSPFLISELDRSNQQGDIVIVANDNSNRISFAPFASIWNESGIQIDIAKVTDMTDVETTLNQAISGMKSLAGAAPETTVAKYMTLPAAYQYAMAALITNWETSLTENKNPVYVAFNSGTFAITDVRYTAPLNESFATAVYKEIDFTNNYIYDMTITFNAQKLFFECTCHEATSLS